MKVAEALSSRLGELPRATLATLPTPLEQGPTLPSGAALWVKRDDLSGLGMGGNKARKLELLLGDAMARGCDTLVTVGAAQSNHARMTAAAGARLGLETHLVLGGDPPEHLEGNQLLDRLFGAVMHHPLSEDWKVLSAAAQSLAAELGRAGRRVAELPMGGSTAIGACGFADGFNELMRQCTVRGLLPSAVVHASSTGGTHAGLLVGQSAWVADGFEVPDLLAVGVAKAAVDLVADATSLAAEALAHLGLEGVKVDPKRVEVDGSWIGSSYAAPSPEGDSAICWAARRGGWVLDRTYTGKAMAGLLGADASGRFAPGESVVFWHTGGQPAVFATGGSVSCLEADMSSRRRRGGNSDA
ncbi:MAG: 1-aminocyclopropane-1-carboxylate deaminase/D-cysteine desulfhydrase [Acidimicrobiales bacterium]